MDSRVVAEYAMTVAAPEIDGYGTYGVSYGIAQNGAIVAHVSSHAQAMRVRDFYRTEFGGTWDIIEVDTIDAMGNTLFAGTPHTFSHEPSHVVADVPMYDVHHNGKLVARNLTDAASRDFIIALLDTDGIADGARIYDTCLPGDLDELFGITRVQYNPAQNDAPAPTPVSTMRIEGKFGNVKRVGKRAKVKSTEIRYSAIPKPGKAAGAKKAHTHYVLDVATLAILHSGNKMTGTSYMAARREVGYKNHTMRVVKTSEYASYIASIHEDGWRVISRGQVVCIGTKEECKAYITQGIVERFLVKESTHVEKVVL